MSKEEILEKINQLEGELSKMTSTITEEEIKNATKEEKIKYLELITEIKIKIEILKNI